MLQNPRKTLGFKKNMVYEIPPGGEVNHIQPVAYNLPLPSTFFSYSFFSYFSATFCSSLPSSLTSLLPSLTSLLPSAPPLPSPLPCPSHYLIPPLHYLLSSPHSFLQSGERKVKIYSGIIGLATLSSFLLKCQPLPCVYTVMETV